MAEHTGAFSKFMGLCDKVTGHDQEVLKLIKKRHQRAKADFIQSEGFIKLLQHTSESITKDTSNKYVHIKDLLTELKAYQDQPIKPSRISNLHGESHTDSSARKRMFDSDTDSIPDMKRYHIDVSTDLDENSKDSNISEPTIEGHRPVKKNHEGNCDSSTLAARHAHLDDIEELSARNGASVLSPNKQKLSVLVTDCVSSKRYKNAAAGDVETLETTVGNGGDGLGNGGNIVPYAGMAGEGALDIGDRCRSSEVADSSATKAKGSERHIIKLEELLKEISKRIKKLEEKDISLDEMEDDSAYTLVERYKSKFVKVWNKLCSIKGRAPTTGRTIERKFHFEGTRYPEVNKRIERFINRHKIFPDFHDIYEVVTRCNVKHCLRLGRKTINVIAREAFIDVGNQLQERRIRDFQGNFGCHLTESYRERNDPALYDKELHSKLNANKVQWKSSMDEVINKFVKQQEVGDDKEEEEEEVDEAASDGELLHDEQVGSRGTSGERDRDDADKEEVKEEKVAVDAEIDEKKDVEDSGVTKEEEEDLKGKDITTEGMEGDKEEVWEREDGSKGDEIENRDLKDEVKTESGRRIKPKMGSQEEDELSRPLQAGCRDSVKVVSSHGALAAVDCVDSHTSGEPPSADDSDGNNMCDVNTNTREWHNTDDDSNSFNSYDMNIVERDYSDDSKNDEDTETCCNLSSSSSSSSDHYSSSSSNDGSDSQLWKKKNSPDPARCDNSATDTAEAVNEKALCKSLSSDADDECLPDLDTNRKCTDRQHSDSDVLILDETEAQPYSKCMFSPSKLKIQSRDFHLPCFHGLQSDAPIIIDQDDKTTSLTEKSPNNLDDTALVGTMPTCGKLSEQSCSNSKMNIKIKNYRSLSSNIVVKVTTPDSTTSTDCWPALAPQIDKHGATETCRQQPWKSMALPVVSDEVIELSDSE